MSEFDRLWKITMVEIAKHAPTPQAMEWISRPDSGFEDALADVLEKLHAFRAKGDVAAYKKALRVYYKLHLESFKHYSEEHALPQPSDSSRLRELTPEEIERFRSEGNDWEICTPAGTVFMVAEKTGRSDRVEFTPETMNDIIRILIAFPGSTVSNICKLEPWERNAMSKAVGKSVSRPNKPQRQTSNPVSTPMPTREFQETFNFTGTTGKDTPS